ncbi:hypothetical protein CCZ01_03225 [Helicobacter monodelphidis]|uniref:hydrogenase small subunit n=1 Tax=Helicobacter sp. 15-1451 TaxID=2004995 RepID=UPI000DCC7BD4|nr:hydrogenase small subunit [Helicobacter sp. 15-1451]RAX58442.1 hypothetical protein CCZ01_03225 [Helicobacter sp. 15-1451]
MQNTEKLQQRLESLKLQGNKQQKSISLRDEKSQKWIAENLKLLSIPKESLETTTEILETLEDIKIVWLHMEECSGCSESILRSSLPTFETLIFDVMRIEYHDMLMAGSGHQCKENLERIVKEGKYILLVEGSISLGSGEFYVTIGSGGKSGADEIKELGEKALAIFAVGSCACYGGIQVAYPNPTHAYPIKELLPHKDIVQIAGCPPSDRNIAVSLMSFFLFGETPESDDLGRPLWAYGKCLHDLCERKSAFLAGEFVEEFGDEKAIAGACLYKVGCRGPYVFNNCPKIKFNDKISWPIAAGHGCLGCSEPDFWDTMAQFEEPMGNNIYHFPTPVIQPKLPPYQTCSTKIPNYSLESLNQSPFLTKEHTLGIVLDHNYESYLFCSQDSQLVAISQFEFETNPRLLLEKLQNKTKQQASLFQNYSLNFKDAYTSLPPLAEEMSKNLFDFYKTLALWIGKNEDFFDLAHAFHHPHESLYPLKFKQKDNLWQVDYSKFIINYLAYAIGGLDCYGLAYGAIVSYANDIAEVLLEITRQQETQHLWLCGDGFADSLLREKTLKKLKPFQERIYILV